jgi:lysyl-tRNA synthetase class 2
VTQASTSWQPTATRAALELRARMLRAAREYFWATDALEVETPYLSSTPVTDVHLQSMAVRGGNRPAFLHTSPEYAMKRLLAAGSPSIWQIARVFRAGEVGRWHNPEFTMIEWYRLGIDHLALMQDVERLIRTVLPTPESLGATEHLTYRQAMLTHAGIDPLTVESPELAAHLRDAGIDVPATVLDDRDACLDLAMSTLVIPQLGKGRLTFVVDFPASQASLARIRGPVASRFETFWQGIELANGFHELCDGEEQRARFEHDRAERARRNLSPAAIDEYFLAALAHGLPECAGVALGFDRLMMCAMEAKHIEEVLTFPWNRT